MSEFTPSGSSPQPRSQGLTAASVHTPGLPHPSSGLSLRHVPHGLPEPCSGKEPWLPTVITGLINHPYWLPSLSHFHTTPPPPIAFPYSPQYKLFTFQSFSRGLLLGKTNRLHLQCPSQYHLPFVVSSDPLLFPLLGQTCRSLFSIPRAPHTYLYSTPHNVLRLICMQVPGLPLAWELFGDRYCPFCI